MEKRLERSDDQKVLGGVMGGLADYFGGDVVLWRLGVILLALLTAIVPVAIVYGLAWWIVPERKSVTYKVVE